jgi:TolB-like protein
MPAAITSADTAPTTPADPQATTSPATQHAGLPPVNPLAVGAAQPASLPINPLAGGGITATPNPAIPENPLARQAKPVSPPPTVGPPHVLILSFDAVDRGDKREWIGRGIQHALLSDLARVNAIWVQSVSDSKGEPPRPGTIDTAAALTAGRAASAQFVICGSFQIVEPELRIIGIVLNVRTGEPVGSLKATGTVRDLFGMEDSITNQARRLLPGGKRMVNRE